MEMLQLSQTSNSGTIKAKEQTVSKVIESSEYEYSQPLIDNLEYVYDQYNLDNTTEQRAIALLDHKLTEYIVRQNPIYANNKASRESFWSNRELWKDISKHT
jgi:hypothetical protein